ncbi:elongation factor P [Candidatus Saccharibacteria bacterium]|nr:elongation factor P [Candidatus Saccharibacteria bacterium]
MALSITNLKKGTIFQLNGVPHRVMEYSHKVMGRGGASVSVKIKSLIDGKVLTKTFHGNDTVDTADVSNRPMQYLYSDNKFHFMDPSTYEQFELGAETMEDKAGYLKEGDNITAQFFEGRIINVELPKNVPLKVTYTENAVRGDTSTAITKDAKLETGITIKVPAFIKTGDLISVDTTTGTYRERVK